MTPRQTRRLGAGVAIALGATLVLLIAHAWMYRFQCDDAFISFRYARNFAHGFGLVFNPGFERVEGYTNLLWVMILAAFARMGIPPEQAANPLSLLATVVLWALVVRFAWRRNPEPRWIVVVPALLLAATRSVAVWSTSGLETRLFEVLIVAGVLRLVVEIERLSGGGAPPRAAAGWLLAFATLARPDGLLIAGSVVAVSIAVLAARRQLSMHWLRATLVPYAVIVGGHYLFRRVYYGDWLPNTFYAKVGHPWWSAGAAYLSAFTLEYAAYLWVPLIAAAVVWHVRRGSGHVPGLFAAAILPHALYVAAVGGDHFEYRPLDLYFPFAFLLVGDGIGMIARSRARVWGATACLVLLVAGLWEIPWQSHRQFVDHYAPGFPGTSHASTAPGAHYLDADRDPIYRLPGLRAIAVAHRRLIGFLTHRFIAIRQEEHRMFLASASDQAALLQGVRDRGLLPPDVRIAVSCVGVIPYELDVYTLDRLGLTDAHVAHSPMVLPAIMAHGKMATMAYARARGVDLWAVDPVHLVVPITSTRVLMSAREAHPDHPQYVADVGNDNVILCELPGGLGQAKQRLPRLHFQRTNDPAFIETYVQRTTAAFESLIRKDPGNLTYWRRYAFLIMVQNDFSHALEIYRRLTAVIPDDADAWENQGLCQQHLADTAGAIASLQRARVLYHGSGDAGSERRVADKLAALRVGAPGAGGGP